MGGLATAPTLYFRDSLGGEIRGSFEIREYWLHMNARGQVSLARYPSWTLENFFPKAFILN